MVLLRLFRQEISQIAQKPIDKALGMRSARQSEKFIFMEK